MKLIISVFSVYQLYQSAINKFYNRKRKAQNIGLEISFLNIGKEDIVKIIILHLCKTIKI